MTPKAKPEAHHLHVTTRAEWRAWLAAHHDTETEIWLVFYKRETGQPRVPYGDAVEEALCFGWIDSIAKKLDDDRYTQKFTPRKDTGKWSASNLERMERLLAAGLVTPAGLARYAPEASPQRYQSGDAVPAFIEEALTENPTARETFARLAPSHRREYIRWITEAKKEETRLRRLQEALRRLEQNEKLGLK